MISLFQGFGPRFCVGSEAAGLVSCGSRPRAARSASPGEASGTCGPGDRHAPGQPYLVHGRSRFCLPQSRNAFCDRETREQPALGVPALAGGAEEPGHSNSCAGRLPVRGKWKKTTQPVGTLPGLSFLKRRCKGDHVHERLKGKVFLRRRRGQMGRPDECGCSLHRGLCARSGASRQVVLGQQACRPRRPQRAARP